MEYTVGGTLMYSDNVLKMVQDGDVVTRDQ